MNLRGFTVLEADGVKTDFNHFNTTTNSYMSKSNVPKRQAPQKLILSAIAEFKHFCASYHIDASKYPFMQAVMIEGDWRQIEFLDAMPDKNPSIIRMHSIIYREQTYVILQRVFDL